MPKDVIESEKRAARTSRCLKMKPTRFSGKSSRMNPELEALIKALDAAIE